jgi:hypothetical protein
MSSTRDAPEIQRDVSLVEDKLMAAYQSAMLELKQEHILEIFGLMVSQKIRAMGLISFTL